MARNALTQWRAVRMVGLLRKSPLFTAAQAATRQYLSREHSALDAAWRAGRSVFAPRRKHHELEHDRNQVGRLQGRRPQAVEQAHEGTDPGHDGQPRPAVGPRAAGLCHDRCRRRSPDQRMAEEADGEARRRREELTKVGRGSAGAKLALLSFRSRLERTRMTREQWLWLRASVALVAAGAVAMRNPAALTPPAPVK